MRLTVALLHALVFACVAALRTWTATFAIDAAALACWLALLARSIVRGLRPDGPPPGRAMRALALAPLVIVLAAHAAAEHSPRGLGLVLALAVAAILLPVTARGRVAQACVLSAAPVGLVVLVLALMRGTSGGVVMLLLSLLDYAYRYTASGIPWVRPAVLTVSAVTFVAARFAWRDTLVAALAALATVYAGAFGVLFGLYYDPPLDHTAADVAAQPDVHVLPLDPALHPGRKSVWIDDAETRLVAIARSTAMWAPLDDMGVVAYDLASRRVVFSPIAAPCNAFVVDPANQRLVTCAFFSRRVLELDLRTLEQTRSTSVDTDRPDGVVRLDAARALVRVEIPGHGHDLRVVDLASLSVAPGGISVPHPPLVVQNSGLDVDLERGRVFLVTTGNEVSMLRRLDASGTVERSVTLPGISWEMRYSPYYRAVFVPLLDRELLYRVDDESFAVTALPAPNAIRGLRVTPDGMLVLGDYVRGKVYVYDPRTARVVRTLLVGSKPEGLALGPRSGALYVYSGAGIVVFDRTLLRTDETASIPHRTPQAIVSATPGRAEETPPSRWNVSAAGSPTQAATAPVSAPATSRRALPMGPTWADSHADRMTPATTPADTPCTTPAETASSRASAPRRGMNRRTIASSRFTGLRISDAIQRVNDARGGANVKTRTQSPITSAMAPHEGRVARTLAGRSSAAIMRAAL